MPEYTPNIALFQQKVMGRYWALCPQECGNLTLADPKEIDLRIAPFVLKQKCKICSRCGGARIYRVDPISERLQVIRNAEVAIGRNIRQSDRIYLMDGNYKNISTENMLMSPSPRRCQSPKINYKKSVIGGQFWCLCPGPCNMVILRPEAGLDQTKPIPVSIQHCLICYARINNKVFNKKLLEKGDLGWSPQLR